MITLTDKSDTYYIDKHKIDAFAVSPCGLGWNIIIYLGVSVIVLEFESYDKDKKDKVKTKLKTILNNRTYI